MKFRSILFCLLFLAGSARTQVVFFDARSAALGDQLALVQIGAGNLFHNPALMSDSRSVSLWVHYYRPFGLPDIRVQGLAGAFRTGLLSVGLGYLAYGNPLFQERTQAVAMSLQLLSNLAAGVVLKRHVIAIQRYGKTPYFRADLGFHLRATSRLELAALFRNALAAGPERARQNALPEYVSAAKARLHSRASLYVELHHSRNFSPMFKMGFELKPTERIHWLVGSGLNSPNSFATGFRLSLLNLAIHYAYRIHPVLPATHLFSLTYHRGNKTP